MSIARSEQDKYKRYLGDGKASECLVFEDRRRGCGGGEEGQVCWVAHVGLRGVWRGGEGFDGGDGEVGRWMRRRLGMGLAERGGGGEEQLGSEDAWAEMLMSLEKFDYDRCGIRLKHGWDL